MLSKTLAIFLIAAAIHLNSPLRAATPAQSGWSQWGGPNRDHKSLETGLQQQWPAGGPKLVWKYGKAGFAYSSPAVVDGRLYSLGSDGGKNFVFCLDSQTGKEHWRTVLGDAPSKSSYDPNWGAGPRSTPTVIGGRVIALDDGGICCALDAKTGAIAWKVSLMADFSGQMPNWGYSESPLVDNDRVVVCPGGDQFLVMLDLETGKKLLSSTGFSERPHYVSVVKHTVDGTGMYITAAQSGLVGFSTETGKKLWTNPSTGNSLATILTPIVSDRFVYHTSAYGAGSALVELKAVDGKVTATEVYANKVMQNLHGGVVLHDGNVFGYRRGGGWVCQDFKTGALKWSTRIAGDTSVSLAFADGRLYLFGESSGTCYLVEPSESQWKVSGKLSLPEKSQLERSKGQIWTHPVIAEGKLFLRDLDLIFAFDVRR